MHYSREKIYNNEDYNKYVKNVSKINSILPIYKIDHEKQALNYITDEDP